MFPLNTILAWNINIIMNKKYDNNNNIMASRAYFLHLFLKITPDHIKMGILEIESILLGQLR
jgi:hypothetical protein